MSFTRIDVPHFVKCALEKYSDEQFCGEIIATVKRPVRKTKLNVITQIYACITVLWKAGEDSTPPQRCSLCGSEIPSGCLYEGTLVLNRYVDIGREWRSDEINKPLKVSRQGSVIICANTRCKENWQPTHQRFYCATENPCTAWHVTADMTALEKSRT